MTSAIRVKAQELISVFFRELTNQEKESTPPPDSETIELIVDKISKQFAEAGRPTIHGIVTEEFREARLTFTVEKRAAEIICSEKRAESWDLKKPEVRRRLLNQLLSEFGIAVEPRIREIVEMLLARDRHLQLQEVYTREEAAEFLRISIPTLDKLVYNQKIVPNKETRRVLFPRAELQRWANSKKGE